MQLLRNNPVSLYKQIADHLRHNIAQGSYEPTGRLPSEAQIMEQFAVSRVTVRLALDDLENEGLIERRKGKGTFVVGKQVRHRIDTLRSFHESLKIQGLDATMRMIDVQAIDTPTSLIPHFGPRCTRLIRLHLVSNEPVALGRSFLPQFISTLDVEVIERNPTYALVDAQSEEKIISAEIEIGAKVVDAAIAGPLWVEAGAFLLVMERASFFDSGARAEKSEFYIRPERYKFILASQLA
ncbi:GntR family transcriptional regulator [Rhizobium puerariae]|uniref:GntR family transcriptional regulator n=1 Tax=Rhizobium puerariae TaxID=1585791 RepID=A0ABV6AJB6_9HYPH